MIQILQGDCLQKLGELPDASVHCCVTSPPYWGLRDYGVAGQIGLEKTPEDYVAVMVGVFREVRRVLRDDGTLWLNLGDSYNGYYANQRGTGLESQRQESRPYFNPGEGLRSVGLKPKDLCMIPARIALALQADGWYLRSDIIWHKPNPMPESVTDRPTKSHEYIFLLAKSERYYYDAEAIKEQSETPSGIFKTFSDANGGRALSMGREPTGNEKPGAGIVTKGTRNKRDVWTVNSQPYPESHFATFPEDLIKPCILAGCPVGGTVLDPFGGSGTTGQVALELGRKAILIELNPKYIPLIERRTNVTPGLQLA